MLVQLQWITGVCLGIEWDYGFLIIDLGIIRIAISNLGD